jgi:hypothetical protein
MSKYFIVHRESRRFSDTEQFKYLIQVLWYIIRWVKDDQDSEYTFTIEERDGYELLEMKELKRLKKKYEPESEATK